MRFARRVLLRLRALFLRRAADRDLDDEIRFHLEQETARNIGAGMPPEEARRRARVAFGNVPEMREAHGDAFGVRWIRDFAADGRHALRALRRSPVLAGAAVVTLALGIGANTAIFSAVDAVILRRLPFSQPDRLVMLWETNPDYQWTAAQAAPANMFDWRERVAAFADIGAYADFRPSVTLAGMGQPRLLKSAQVTGNFFSVLGVPAELGRTFREDETWENGAHVAVISDRLWRGTFDADPSIVGRSVSLDGRPVQIVGVVPPTFAYPFEDGDVWTPVEWKAGNRSQVFFRRAHWLRPVGRLKPGVTLQAADAELQAVVKQLQREYALTNRVMGAGMTPLHDWLVRDSRQPLLVLMAAVALLLLIACANVGNLLLVQAAGREREAAMRLALGAGRGRLVRQALTESIVLSSVGALAGLGVGWCGTRALVALQPPGMLPVHDVHMDAGVLLFVAAVAAVSGMLFGLAPAFWSRHRVPAEVLKAGGRSGSAGTRLRHWGNALVVGEVAITLMLTVGAGLLVRSFRALTRVDPGFDSAGVLAVQLNASGARYDSVRKVIAFYDETTGRAAALPGVTAAAAVSDVPLTGWGWTGQCAIAGRAEQYTDEVAHRVVTPGYLGTMHVRLVRGRDFTPRDARGAPPVVLINESLARRFFGGQDPIGQRVAFDRVPDSTSTWWTIVGVVGDERQTSLGADTKMQFTTPFAQSPRTDMTLVLRTGGDPAALGPSVRRMVADVDPTLAITSMRTMDAVRDASLARQQFLMTMLLAFAGVGIVLAVVGVYGVMAQMARGRTREMGIRIALGAPRAAVRWLVVRQGLRIVALGLVVGLGVALPSTQAMRAFLFHITPVDPVTFVAVPLLLLLTGAAAAWVPAARASRADPASTLRQD